MAFSWFRYNPPGVSPSPAINPLSYTQILFTPPFTATGFCICFIFAETQIIAGVVRPVITPILSADINNALATGTSSSIVIVCFCF